MGIITTVTEAVALSYFETDISRFLHLISVISILLASYNLHISFLQTFRPPFCMHFQSLPHVCTDLVMLNIIIIIITILLTLRLQQNNYYYYYYYYYYNNYSTTTTTTTTTTAILLLLLLLVHFFF